mmetsp:Transcript_27802/g.36441  ORF Transcript_27802/g.36441 Transcript_27802/m.36441 type:complete len:811 (+) Transcript_27802:182-2614(+)
MEEKLIPFSSNEDFARHPKDKHNQDAKRLLLPFLVAFSLMLCLFSLDYSRSSAENTKSQLGEYARVVETSNVAVKPKLSSSVPLVQAILLNGVDSSDPEEGVRSSMTEYLDKLAVQSSTLEENSNEAETQIQSTSTNQAVTDDVGKTRQTSSVQGSGESIYDSSLNSPPPATENPMAQNEVTQPAVDKLTVADVKLSETGHSLKEYLKALTIKQLRHNGNTADIDISKVTLPLSVKSESAKTDTSTAHHASIAKATVVEAQPAVTAVEAKLSQANFEAVPSQPSKHVENDFVPEAYHRFPQNFQKYTNNLFDHPKVIEAFDSLSTDVKKKAKTHCFGPENNIDSYVNEELLDSDLKGPSTGYTVFCLDCRDENAYPLVAFIVIMDRYGSIVNIHNPPSRAESVVMYDTNHVLFSTIGNSGRVALWNWKDDSIQLLPFEADAHTVQFAQSQGVYYALERAKEKNSPSVAVAYDKKGKELWSYSQPYSHINWLTVDGEYVYLSLRSDSSIVELNRYTGKMERIIGGKYSTVKIVGHKGKTFESKDWHTKTDFTLWNHQHKFQYLDNDYFSLFDNHVGNTHEFIDGDNSRMVVLHVDDISNTAYEVFSFDTGDKAHIYGSADVMPSGNVLGNSYHYLVDPMDVDRQYHANIWEVTPDGQLAMRIGFKGLNPFEPEDRESKHPHAVTLTDEPPVGWVIFDVERLYEEPQISEPCAGAGYIQILPFNTIRTQEAIKGVVTLFDVENGGIVNSVDFTFHRSWLPEELRIPIGTSQMEKELILQLSNEWGDTNTIPIGKATGMPACSVTASTRIMKN